MRTKRQIQYEEAKAERTRRDAEYGKVLLEGERDVLSQVVTPDEAAQRTARNRAIAQKLLADIDDIFPEEDLTRLRLEQEAEEAKRREVQLDEARSRIPSVEALQRENTRKIWVTLVGRMRDPEHKGYRNWGALGIRMADRWVDSFDAFVEDIGVQPSPLYELKRTTSSPHFEPGNVEWGERGAATPHHRAKGGRPKRGDEPRVDYEGQMVTLPELSTLTGIKYQTIMARWYGGKRTIEQLTLPVRANATGQAYNVTLANTETGTSVMVTLKDLCEAKGVPYTTAISRLRAGKTMKDALAPRRPKQTAEERRAKQRQYYRDTQELSQVVTDKEM